MREFLRVLRLDLALVDQRVHSTGRVTGGRGDARVEIDVDADRAAFLRAEPRQFAEPIPAHRCSHLRLPYRKAAILCVCACSQSVTARVRQKNLRTCFARPASRRSWTSEGFPAHAEVRSSTRR